eukprot:CAMPEP_0117668450 /NCGR_PEP_ID=MMETSP0804-20121206/11558_1 /TAXON_ID=1074897 /ORGANISM="Tetraselmis astigmatica, Strain CCMP880" /LENGTH=32 /DNA_ID= /DNA_START= /DNA_END= /DNA_ORIENTATION=
MSSLVPAARGMSAGAGHMRHCLLTSLNVPLHV